MKLLKKLPEWVNTWDFIGDIEYASDLYKIDLDILVALIQTESGGRCNSVRYEQYFKWAYKIEDITAIAAAYRDSGHYINVATLDVMQRHSFGLMQAMGTIFFQYNFHIKSEFELLPIDMINPRISLEVGCRHLRQLIDAQKLSKPLDIYAAYNAGSARILNGKYSNQANVDNFNKYYQDIQKLN